MSELSQTVTICIGNSDNKLDQAEWSNYCHETAAAVNSVKSSVHFEGGSSFDSRRQNACWVVEIFTVDVELLCERLTKVRKKYRQESIAFLPASTTRFI